MVDRYYSGQGKLYAAARDGGGNPLGFRFLGNCNGINLNPGMQMLQYATDTSAGGVVSALNSTGPEPELAITLENFSKENLSISLYSGNSVVNAGTATAEVITARLGLLVPLANINVTAVSSVTNSAVSITYTVGTDYTVELSGGGIVFPATGSAISNAQSIKVTYTYGGYEKIGAFTSALPFYSLKFIGVDHNNVPIVCDFFKTRLMQTGDIALIGENLASMQFKVQLFYDSTQTGGLDEGKVFRIRRV